MTVEPFPIFVGWDSREDIAYHVCRRSLLARASVPVAVAPIKQHDLRKAGHNTRPADPLASTEFTYTRFFLPFLAGYRGLALFRDCDFLWLADILGLIDLADDRFALMWVHHDHRPTEDIKMDGRKQIQYPRKNWSRLILYTCGHEANGILTPDTINRESGAFLHRFQWLDDELIGAVPETWNWLKGWCAPPANGFPNVVHYTRGGPWFDEWRDVAYANLLQAEMAAVRSQQAAE